MQVWMLWSLLGSSHTIPGEVCWDSSCWFCGVPAPGRAIPLLCLLTPVPCLLLSCLIFLPFFQGALLAEFLLVLMPNSQLWLVRCCKSSSCSLILFCKFTDKAAQPSLQLCWCSYPRVFQLQPINLPGQPGSCILLGSPTQVNLISSFDCYSLKIEFPFLASQHSNAN